MKNKKEINKILQDYGKRIMKLEKIISNKNKADETISKKNP